MMPFSPNQKCPKCKGIQQLLPRHHKAWFSRDEWLEYECVCGYTFRTETAEAPSPEQKQVMAFGDHLMKRLENGPIDVVSELDKAHNTPAK